MTVLLARLATSCAPLVVLTACGASREYFRPMERAVAESPEGEIAAEYRLGFDKDRWGEVRVWCGGAREREIDGAYATVLDIGFAIKNVTDTPLELDLDKLRVESLRSDQPAPPPIAPHGRSGRARAEPHALTDVELEFVLPAGLAPSDVTAFQVHWTLHGPNEMAYEQFTPFARYRPYYRDYYYWYDDWGPYWYPYAYPAPYPWWRFHGRWYW